MSSLDLSGLKFTPSYLRTTLRNGLTELVASAKGERPNVTRKQAIANYIECRKLSVILSEAMEGEIDPSRPPGAAQVASPNFKTFAAELNEGFQKPRVLHAAFDGMHELFEKAGVDPSFLPRIDPEAATVKEGVANAKASAGLHDAKASPANADPERRRISLAELKA